MRCLPPVVCTLLMGICMLQSRAYAQSWHTYQTTSQVKIEYTDPVNCSFSGGTEAEYIFLKFQNLTGQPIQVSFHVEHYYVGSGCTTCNNDEYQYTIQLPANGTISTDCHFASAGQSKLAIFKKFITRPNPTEFEKFEITHLTIE